MGGYRRLHNRPPALLGRGYHRRYRQYELSCAHSVNCTLVLRGRVTYAGNTSLEVCVEGFIENYDLSRTLVMTCYMLFVGVDQAGRPVKVPG